MPDNREFIVLDSSTLFYYKIQLLCFKLKIIIFFKKGFILASSRHKYFSHLDGAEFSRWKCGIYLSRLRSSWPGVCLDAAALCLLISPLWKARVSASRIQAHQAYPATGFRVYSSDLVAEIVRQNEMAKHSCELISKTWEHSKLPFKAA